MPSFINSEISRNGFTSSNIASSRNTSGGLTESVFNLTGSDDSPSGFGRKNADGGTVGAVNGFCFEITGKGGGVGAKDDDRTVVETTSDAIGVLTERFGVDANVSASRGVKKFDFGAPGFGLKSNGGGFGAINGGVFFNGTPREFETGGTGNFGAVKGKAGFNGGFWKNVDKGGFGAVDNVGRGKIGACGERNGTRGVGRRTLEVGLTGAVA